MNIKTHHPPELERNGGGNALPVIHHNTTHQTPCRSHPINGKSGGRYVCEVCGKLHALTVGSGQGVLSAGSVGKGPPHSCPCPPPPMNTISNAHCSLPGSVAKSAVYQCPVWYKVNHQIKTKWMVNTLFWFSTLSHPVPRIMGRTMGTQQQHGEQ